MTKRGLQQILVWAVAGTMLMLSVLLLWPSLPLPVAQRHRVERADTEAAAVAREIVAVAMATGTITRERPGETQIRGDHWRTLTLDQKRTLARAVSCLAGWRDVELVDDHSGRLLARVRGGRAEMGDGR